MMVSRIMIFLIAITVASCGAKPLPPMVDLKRFEDTNYPCIQIDFPDQIRYKGMKMYKTEDNLAIAYKLSMPNYDINIVKFYGIIEDINWSYESLGELHDSPTTIYSKKGKEDNAEVSSLIVVFERGGELFLRGSVGSFLSKDRAFRVDVVRRIKKIGAFRKDVFENWKNSSTGSKTIDNMQKIVDHLYINSGATDCRFRGNIDMDWWKK